jgi:hypothetical protein
MPIKRGFKKADFYADTKFVVRVLKKRCEKSCRQKTMKKSEKPENFLLFRELSSGKFFKAHFNEIRMNIKCCVFNTMFQFLLVKKDF